MNGFDLTEFSQMITQLEQLGADMDQVAERVLDAGSEPARQAFAKNVPLDEETQNRTYDHARDKVVVSRTRTAKRTRNKYRLVEAKTNKKDANGNIVPYLYYVENGSTKAPAKPWVEKAYRAAQVAASEPMADALVHEIEDHLR